MTNKKTAKRTTKKAGKKAAAKKVSKKTTKKSAAKKTTKKAATRKSASKKVAKKPAARKATTKKTARKTAGRKKVAKKTATRKTASKKAAAKRVTKKTVTKKTAKKTASKKAAARKTVTKKPASKKPTSKKTAKKKTVSKKTVAKKVVSKKAPSRTSTKKTAAKKPAPEKPAPGKPAAATPTPERPSPAAPKADSGDRKGGKRRDDRGRRSGKRRPERDTQTQSSARGETRRGPTPKPKPKPKPGQEAQEVFDDGKTFDDLGLDEAILRGIKQQGFEKPTSIQAQLIPVALTGKDVLGQAKTGTGKTAAFGLPLLQMAKKGKRFQALVLAPTRELAVQIAEELRELGRHSGLRVATVYGGQKIVTQAERLAKGPEIIVGTPGRVMDMNERGYLKLSEIQFAILDEVDRMFDIGFRDDIRKILRMCPEQRQTIFVSATISAEIEDLARRHMQEPEKIVTSSGSLTVSLVEQHYLTVQPWDKRRLLVHLLTHEDPALTIVFCRLKKTVDRLTEHLIKKGIEAVAIHGDMRQGKRNSVMKAFKGGKLACLIASDLASRGIDVDGITHVVNYDLPDDPDIYVHRIGRTARAGRGGVAWSFDTPEEGKLLSQIEDLINAVVPELEYPDFEGRDRPDNWKDERPNAPYVVTGVKKPDRNRLGGPEMPKTATIDKQKAASQFPGGVVPSKLPPKMMGGRVRARR